LFFFLFLHVTVFACKHFNSCGASDENSICLSEIVLISQ
jgi:hypothetical protein